MMHDLSLYSICSLFLKFEGANQELGDSHHECCHDKLLARLEEPTPGVC